MLLTASDRYLLLRRAGILTCSAELLYFHTIYIRKREWHTRNVSVLDTEVWVKTHGDVHFLLNFAIAYSRGLTSKFNGLSSVFFHRNEHNRNVRITAVDLTSLGIMIFVRALELRVVGGTIISEK